MKLNFTFGFITVFLSFSFLAAYTQTIYIDNGSSDTYTLQTGDSLYVSKGTFTGKIKDWAQGGKVTIAVGATFKPTSVEGFRSKYLVYGSAILPALQTESGFGLENHGVLTINGNTQMNGGAQIWNNAANATINFKGSVAFNAAGSIFANDGEVFMDKSFAINSTAAITNRKNILIGDGFTIGKGQLQNEGYLYAQKDITVNSNSLITNTCRMVSGKAITINSGTVYNSGLLWASNEQNASAFTNSGTIISLDQGIIKAVKFTNYGTLKGNGFMYLTGKTVGSGTIGINGSTSDSLKVYTVNRSKTTQIFDDQWGTVYPNVVYTVFASPDTLTASLYPCYAESSYSILPVKWQDFSVKLSGNTPVLHWSAQYDKGTLFVVQRSNNGKDFIAAISMEKQEHTNYAYTDDAVSANTPVLIYYRIKAVQPDGKESYSEIKMIRFDSTVVSHISASPNPFVSQVNINYHTSQKGVAAVKVFNLNGQVKFVKPVNVNKGNNSIAITEASGWGAGIYMVAVYAEQGSVIAAKLIKQ